MPIKEEILIGIKKNREIFGKPKPPANVYNKRQKLFHSRTPSEAEPLANQNSQLPDFSHRRILELKNELKEIISQHLD